MSVTLKYKRILVTRPKHQADHLCRLISDSNGEVVLFPTIEIKTILNSEKLSAYFDNIGEYDFAIFVSPNAVRTAFEHYLQSSSLKQTQVLAIGSATASVLSEMNIINVLHAGVQADSERLLKLAQLDREFVRNKKILIVRGVGGRALLADDLRKRGATVDYAEVYQRCLPKYDIWQCHEIWQNKSPDAIIVSSNEGLENLLALTAKTDHKQLFNTSLVVMSARNADLAKKLGFVSKIDIAKTKNDKGLLSSLLKLVGETRE